jgi:hypothetical protein
MIPKSVTTNGQNNFSFFNTMRKNFLLKKTVVLVKDQHDINALTEFISEDMLHDFSHMSMHTQPCVRVDGARAVHLLDSM